MSEHQSDDESAAKKSGYWTRLKKKWNRHGVVEIDIDHQRYDMLQCIGHGLRDLLTSHAELGPKEQLDSSDYSHILRSSITAPNGQIFHFASYASSVFATIRRAIGLPEADFMKSICPEHKPYLEFISNSKSGQSFYLSNDKAYFMKTDKKVAIDFLLNILGEYLHHFLSYPHSLIVKYLGLFSVQLEGGPTKYFYIMQSIFYPDERIERRYDVKGCLAGRYQKPADPDDGPILQIFKDQNFLSEMINVGSQRNWLIKQLKHDARFMKNLGVQDYSLLVGYQQLHVDEKTQDLGDIVQRVQQSVPLPKSKKKIRDQVKLKSVLALKSETGENENSTNSDEMELQVLNGSSESRADERSPDMLAVPGEESNQNNSNSTPSPDQNHRPVRRRPMLGLGHALSFIKQRDSDSSGLQNRRLLPKLARPLHIIDGPECRYFIGIIDFFTLYECRQKVGRVLKSIKHCCGDHSTLPPEPYANRFVAFLEEHIE